MIGTLYISAPRCTPAVCIFSEWFPSFGEELVLFSKSRRGTFLILLPVSFLSNVRLFPQYTEHRMVMTKAIHTNMYFHQISVKQENIPVGYAQPAFLIREGGVSKETTLPGHRPLDRAPPLDTDPQEGT